MKQLADLVITFVGLGAIFIALTVVTKGLSPLRQWRARLAENRTNLVFWFFDGLVIAPIVTLPTILLGKLIPSASLPDLPVILAIGGAVVVGDFVGYWRHRLQHTRYLWPAHAVHHSDRNVSWLTLIRMHPIDRVGTVTIDGLVLLVCGFPLYAVLANSIIRNWYGHFVHADLPWTYGRAGKVLISPPAHRCHHSRDLPGVNFASIFSIWDRAFGTYHHAERAPSELGIDDAPNGFFTELMRPFRKESYVAVASAHRQKSYRIPRQSRFAPRIKIALSCMKAPALLTALMVAGGIGTAQLANIKYSGLIVPYVMTSFGVCVLSTLGWALLYTVRLMLRGDDHPARRILGKIRRKVPYLFLPLLIVPLFLASFTTSKTAIPFLVAYKWEHFWAQADVAIFGSDAWIIAAHWLGTSHIAIFEMAYTAVWGTLLIGGFSLVALYGRPRQIAVFYTAMLATWLIAGFVLAYAFSAAGPVFAELTSPEFHGRFDPLQQFLATHLSPHGTIRLTQQVLARVVKEPTAITGGGVSAMPSVHVAVTMVYVMATRRSHWAVLTVPYWALIFLLSAYFGYHYWIDGIVGSAVAAICWLTAERIYGVRAISEIKRAPGAGRSHSPVPTAAGTATTAPC